MKETTLSYVAEIPVRFSEVDSLQIVWHGHYIEYMEEAREAFGKKYGLSYLDWKANGYMVPLIKISCEFKRPIQYGDNAVVEIDLMDTDAAKIIFSYKIYRASDHELAATGESVQVFLDMDQELVLTVPKVFEEWKIRHGLRK